MKVRYLDREAVQRALEDYARVLFEENPEVEVETLFGSFARGDCVPSSDVDLLLVLKDSDMPLLERIAAFPPSRFPVGADVFPYTREEIGRMLGDGNHFIAAALDEGVELFRRSSAGRV